MLERLTELSKGTIWAFLGTCRGSGCVEIWSLLLPEVGRVTCNGWLRLGGMGRGLYLSWGVGVGGEFVLTVQRRSGVIVEALLGRNMGGLRLVVVGEGWLGDRLGLWSERDDRR